MARKARRKTAYGVRVGKPEGKGPFGRLRYTRIILQWIVKK
jgi:hypothetical protein